MPLTSQMRCRCFQQILSSAAKLRAKLCVRCWASSSCQGLNSAGETLAGKCSSRAVVLRVVLQACAACYDKLHQTQVAVMQTAHCPKPIRTPWSRACSCDAEYPSGASSLPVRRPRPCRASGINSICQHQIRHLEAPQGIVRSQVRLLNGN